MAEPTTVSGIVSGTDKSGIQRGAFKIGQAVDLGTGDAADFADHYFVSGDGSDPLTTANQSGVEATEAHGQSMIQAVPSASISTLSARPSKCWR